MLESRTKLPQLEYNSDFKAEPASPSDSRARTDRECAWLFQGHQPKYIRRVCSDAEKCAGEQNQHPFKSTLRQLEYNSESNRSRNPSPNWYCTNSRCRIDAPCINRMRFPTQRSKGTCSCSHWRCDPPVIQKAQMLTKRQKPILDQP